jgi:hypothetical protein
VKDGFYWARKLVKNYHFKKLEEKKYQYVLGSKYQSKTIVRVDGDEVFDFGSLVSCDLDRYVFLSEVLECDSREEAYID